MSTPMYAGSGSTPVPDPTSLTTEAVTRATEQWRRELAAAIDTIEVRLEAMDQATALRLDALHEIRPMVERQINQLRELNDVKFEAIDQRFTERDVRTDQAAKAAKDALDAALQAAKELVNAQGEAAAAAAVKAEGNTTKQIDQIVTLIQTNQRSTDDRIQTNQKATDDRLQEIKERIDRGEGSHQGAVDTTTARQASTGQLLLAASVLLAAVAIVVAIVIARGGK